MIRSLLIANRGEIAVRVIRTCRRLGIRAVAVFSDADRDARHVALADEAIRIGAAPARDSYLRATAIMEAARRSGAEAIHPGYGFLSERAELPSLCAGAGIVWIGPSADRIAAMGSKISAKRIAAGAGVPTVPGYAGDDQSSARLLDEAERIGFPVMLKASSGGGGRGMRRAASAGELRAVLDLARREAEAAFGDPTLLIERLVRKPRHLEVQVAGDKHGHVVHVFERDCSVQRHHQKLLEEAPAPNLAPSVREKLLGRAVALARAIAYDNLGTVEFVLEQGSGEPWFLEMNTRLQVEHPVTEAITGLDLVEWQIRIACGEPVPLSQAEIRAEGHAIEARVVAEQAEHGFRPGTGRILAYGEPAGVRVESGVARGAEVTQFYDSLLAKVVASGPTREAARSRLAHALREFVLLGPPCTLGFLADAVERPLFAAGEATTGFLDEAFPDGWTPRGRHFELARAVACVLATDSGAWGALTGFRVLAPAGGVAEAPLVVHHGNGTARVAVAVLPGGVRRVSAADVAIALSVRRAAERLEVEAGSLVLPGACASAGPDWWVTLAGETYAFTIRAEVEAPAARAPALGGTGSVLAPLPGTIAEIRVKVGESVTVGQVVAVLESMKLFSSLTADTAGTVAEIACRPGQTVAAGASLLKIAPSAKNEEPAG